MKPASDDELRNEAHPSSDPEMLLAAGLAGIAVMSMGLVAMLHAVWIL